MTDNPQFSESDWVCLICGKKSNDQTELCVPGKVSKEKEK